MKTTGQDSLFRVPPKMQEPWEGGGARALPACRWELFLKLPSSCLPRVMRKKPRAGSGRPPRRLLQNSKQQMVVDWKRVVAVKD